MTKTQRIVMMELLQEISDKEDQMDEMQVLLESFDNTIKKLDEEISHFSNVSGRWVSPAVCNPDEYAVYAVIDIDKVVAATYNPNNDTWLRLNTAELHPSYWMKLPKNPRNIINNNYMQSNK